MARSNVLWLGTLGLLVAGLVIDRSATSRELKDLRHKYAVLAEAATDKANAPGYAVRLQPALQGDASNVPSVTAHEVAAGPRSGAKGSSEAAHSDSESKSAAVETLSWSDQIAHIDTVFSEQARDGSWSREAEDRITNALLPFAEGGARIREVTCRSTLCKVKVEHSTEAGIRDFVNHAFALRGIWNGPVAALADPNAPQGTFADVLYFSKEGHDMPFLEN